MSLKKMTHVVISVYVNCTLKRRHLLGSSRLSRQSCLQAHLPPLEQFNMGAPVGVATAHRRHVSFSDQTAIDGDRQQAAQAHSARACQHDSARPSCDALQSTRLRSDTTGFIHTPLYSCSSGSSLSDSGSETTVQAGSCSVVHHSAFDVDCRSDATESAALDYWSCSTAPSNLSAEAPLSLRSCYGVGRNLVACSFCRHARS